MKQEGWGYGPSEWIEFSELYYAIIKKYAERVYMSNVPRDQMEYVVKYTPYVECLVQQPPFWSHVRVFNIELDMLKAWIDEIYAEKFPKPKTNPIPKTNVDSAVETHKKARKETSTSSTSAEAPSSTPDSNKIIGDLLKDMNEDTKKACLDALKEMLETEEKTKKDAEEKAKKEEFMNRVRSMNTDQITD